MYRLGQSTQFVVNKRHQFIKCFLLAGAPVEQQLGNIG